MTKEVIETVIKWIPELPEMQKRAEDEADKYFRSVEKILAALVQKYGKKGAWNEYELPYKFKMLSVNTVNNNGKFSWKLERIEYWPEQEEISMICEGYDFDVRDFEMRDLHWLCHEIDVTDGKGPEDDDENKDEKDDKEKE